MLLVPTNSNPSSPFYWYENYSRLHINLSTTTQHNTTHSHIHPSLWLFLLKTNEKKNEKKKKLKERTDKKKITISCNFSLHWLSISTVMNNKVFKFLSFVLFLYI